MRRLDGCINCGDEREIAAHGLCFKCYRAAERAQKAAPDPVWARLGYGGLLREQKRAFTIVTNILKAISDCPAIEQSDKKQIQIILRPYLDRLAECFAPKNCKPVKSEQKLAVHSVHSTDCRVWASSRKPDNDYSDGSAEDSETAGDSFSTQIHSGEEQ